MLRKITIENMLGGLEGRLGEDDFTEPLNILIDSANKHNKFNLFGSIAFKNQLKDRLKVRSELYKLIKNHNLPDPSDMIFVTGLPRSGTCLLYTSDAADE